MRIFFLIAMSLPAIASASDWIEVGKTPEARIMLDRESVKTSGEETLAWLKFLYYETQPGQTVTGGKPFDSSLNRYHVVCSTNKYRVLELVLFRKNEIVGSFRADLSTDGFDQAKPGSSVAFNLTKICAAAAMEKN